MASYRGLLAYTGFEYSAVTGIMKFKAIEGQYFWSNGYAYGTIKITKKADEFKAAVKVLHGELKLSKLELKGANTIVYEKGNLLRN